jgi:hypothetical protein
MSRARERAAALEDELARRVNEREAASGPSDAPLNPFAAVTQERERRTHEFLFGKAEPEQTTDRPQGEADGGKGEEDGAIYELTEYGPMRVFDLNPDRKEDDQ